MFWESGVALNALLVLGLLLAASLLVRLPGLVRLGLPVSILAGVLGFLLGPDVGGLIPIDRSVLESAVYHGLAVVFIAVALQSPPAGRRGAGAVSVAFAVPLLGASQALLALLLVLFVGGVHPGFGLLVPYGFEQGPGQALSIGAAWEQLGLESGAQLGLIIAALGFAWAMVFGIPLVWVGRRLGWVEPPTPSVEEQRSPAREASGSGGTLEVLTAQVVAIGTCYLAAYVLLVALARVLAPLPELAAMVWGFQFIVGALIALPGRSLLARLRRNPLDDEVLGRISGLAVDVVTCAALAAVSLHVFRQSWVLLLLVTSGAGVLTLGIALWLQRRAFPDEPFAHSVVLYGMGTGTLPMGFALLRILDPELRGAAPRSFVVGSALAIVTSAPLYLFVLLIPVQQWPDNHPGASWLTVGLLAAYLVGLLALWRLVGALRFRRPWLSPWPPVGR